MKNRYVKAAIGGLITGALIATKVMISCYEAGYTTGIKAANGDKSAERTFKAIAGIRDEVDIHLSKKK